MARRSTEVRMKIAAGTRRHWQDPEARAKHVAGIRRGWENNPARREKSRRALVEAYRAAREARDASAN
jgi:hypothetical protein